jgi:hypothetical protein
VTTHANELARICPVLIPKTIIWPKRKWMPENLF